MINIKQAKKRFSYNKESASEKLKSTRLLDKALMGISNRICNDIDNGQTKTDFCITADICLFSGELIYDSSYEFEGLSIRFVLDTLISKYGFDVQLEQGEHIVKLIISGWE